MSVDVDEVVGNQAVKLKELQFLINVKVSFDPKFPIDHIIR
jgi:hypothetical protein